MNNQQCFQPTFVNVASVPTNVAYQQPQMLQISSNGPSAPQMLPLGSNGPSMPHSSPQLLPLGSNGPILVPYPSPVLLSMSSEPIFVHNSPQPVFLPDMTLVPNLTMSGRGRSHTLPVAFSDNQYASVDRSLTPYLQAEQLLPPVVDFSPRSRRNSLCVPGDSDSGEEEIRSQSRRSPSQGRKQGLITEVQKALGNLLSSHFPCVTEGTIMNVYASAVIPDLDELKDVLRGNHVGNIRAKSVKSLNALVKFLETILGSSEVTVHRVDVILQKKSTGNLKGLLVNMQFSSQEELLHVRDAVWKGAGFAKTLPKFMPAVFAQDCSWKGTFPVDLNYVQCATTGDLRLVQPLPQKLQELDLSENCRIKSMTVVFKTHGKRSKTVEVPKDQFLRVLSEGKCTVKNVERTLTETTQLTVSFEEDWKTNFWRA